MTPFPDYKLSNFQITNSPKARYNMGGSAPQPVGLDELMQLASEKEKQDWQSFSLDYASSRGSAELRETIAALYPGLEADNIVTFAGAQEAIFTTYHALLAPGDLVQVIAPLFEPLAIVAESIGAKLQKQVIKPMPNGEWLLDVDDWVRSLTPATELASINFPHNPTGLMITQDQLSTMVNACADNGTWLFSDEVFRGLEYDQSKQLPPVASIYEKGISLGVVSKMFGLGGVRVGWIACQDRQFLKRLIEIKHFLSICNGQPDELLATIALRNTEQLQQQNRDLLNSNLQLIEDSLPALSQYIRWHPPEGGCVAYPKLLDQDTTDEFAERLLVEKGVLVTPGSCFKIFDEHFRLGFGRDNFKDALTLFCDFL